MLKAVNPDDSLIAARLLDFFSSSVTWHRGLWITGIALTLREALEASAAVRAGVLSEESLKNLGSTCVRMSGLDPGAGDEHSRQVLHQAISGKLRHEGLDFHTISILTDELETNYIRRWAEALSKTEGRPKPERAARCIAAHLLDLGFSSDYLHRWWKYRLKHEHGERGLVEILEDAHRLANLSPKEYEVLVAFSGSPRTASGYPPEWLDAFKVVEWLRSNGFSSRDLRPSGGLIFRQTARDPQSAAQLVGELVDTLLARTTVSSGDFLSNLPHAWVKGNSEPLALARRRRGVRVRALYREDYVYPTNTDQNLINPAIELLAHLEGSSPSAAVAGGWAAIEALLSEPSDRASAAERLAALVACSFPRAELTALSYTLEPLNHELKSDLEGKTENRDRCAVLTEHIVKKKSITTGSLSEQAALERMKRLFANPRKTLNDIKTHVQDVFERLYRQRNLVLHWGKTDALALRSTLRTAAPLVGAGMDRIAHGYLVQGIKPIELAARARISLATASEKHPETCVDLLA